MTGLMQRMRSGLRRMGEWISGDDVPVATDPPPSELARGRPTARPAVDIYQSPAELLLVADVPGSLPDTTHVHVDHGRLTVLARCAVPPGEARRLLGDDQPVDWTVAFTLPDGLDGARAQASHRDGVLTVRLPRHPRAAPRRVPVRSGA